MYTVYCHTNKTNGKKYFGITQQKCKTRWQGGNGYVDNKYFYSAIKKYGWSGFEHEIIMQGLSKEDACNLEQFLIATHDTTNREKGYNISVGGEFGSLGRKMTESQIEAMRQRTKNLWNNEEYRRKNVESHKNYVFTDEQRAKISKASKGHTLTEEQRKKISEALRNSEKFKANRKTWNKGIKYTPEQKEKFRRVWEYTSDETREKISKSVKELWEDSAYREKMVAAHKGKGLKRVLCVELNKIFNSLQEAQKETAIDYSGISKCCHGRANTAGGYHWEFV